VAAIVASVVGLGRSLSLDITAEGVETEDQVALLRAAGCSIVQGFLFGAPSREAAVAGAPAEGEPQSGASAARG
jgi:EAL domain-containing protein (putative c-di-GMP-specific phosphodiesterase class I)